MSTPEPAIADATSPARTVPAGPSSAGELGRSSGAAGGTPCAGRATPDVTEVEFVGGPMNGYRVDLSETGIGYSVPDAGGSYVLDPTGRVAHWHVGRVSFAEPVDEIRPAAPAEHVRPASREGEQTRPRRARRNGR